MKVNILGTKYKIETHKVSEDDALKKNNWSGYCCQDKPLIVLADYDEKEYFDFGSRAEKESYRKECLRHEIIHAFLFESGLKNNSHKSDESWSLNEEMVDWFAIQFPKIQKAFEESGAI